MGFFQRRKLARLVKDGNVDTVLEVLGSNSEVDRCDAAHALGGSDEKRSVDALTILLTDSSLRVRAQAATSLGKIRTISAVVPLINSIKNESLAPFMTKGEKITVVPTKAEEEAEGHGQYMPFVSAVASALINIGASTTAPLRQFLFDDSVRIKGIVANVLRKVGTEEAMSDLSLALTLAPINNEDFCIRAILALAFDRIGKHNHYETIMQHASPYESMRAQSLVRKMDNGDYSDLEKIEQGLTTDTMMKALQEIKKIL